MGRWAYPAWWFLLPASVLLVTVPAALAARHGFHDATAPRQAAHVLLELPRVSAASCRWKIRPQTIACNFTSDALPGTMILWSTGTKILYRGCVQGNCVTRTAKHRFGHPY
jgi:hypothetical protein